MSWWICTRMCVKCDMRRWLFRPYVAIGLECMELLSLPIWLFCLWMHNILCLPYSRYLFRYSQRLSVIKFNKIQIKWILSSRACVSHKRNMRKRTYTRERITFSAWTLYLFIYMVYFCLSHLVCEIISHGIVLVCSFSVI